MKQNKIVGFLNQKGGVGKTTCTMYFGDILASKGYKVLLIDFDPQANLTNYLIDGDCIGIYDVIENFFNASDVVKQIKHNLYLLPNDEKLALLEHELEKPITGAFTLRKLIENNNLLSEYDFILIDANPTVNAYSYNVLLAINEVIIPTSLSPAIISVKSVYETIQAINESNISNNQKIKIAGVLVNRYCFARKKNQQFYNNLKKYCEDHKIYLFEKIIKDKAVIERLDSFFENEIEIEFDDAVSEYLKKYIRR